MKIGKMLATIALSAVMLTGCSFKKSEVIVKVNDQDITMAQFDKAFDKATNNPMFKQMGIDVKGDKNHFLHIMIKDRVINELIIKTLIDEEMTKRNIVVTKNDINEELKSIIDKIGSKEKFNEILKQNGVTSAEFKSDLEDEVKMKKLVNSLEKVEVSDAEIKKFYKENIAKFKYPEKVRASHILITADPNEIKEVIKSDAANAKLDEKALDEKVNDEIAKRAQKADEILTEVRKDPTSFAKIAKSKSEDVASAKQGGDLGFFAKQEMVEPFSKAAFSMKPNTISAVVKSPFGFHIIMVTDRMAAGQEPLEKVKPEIKAYLENQKQVKVLQNLVESLKKNAKIEYVNAEFNPSTMQEALKKQAKNNPAAQEEVNGANRSATPAPQAKKAPAKK